MVIFQCRDQFDSILCGVYDAWMSRLGHDNVRLELEHTGNMEMFAEYRTVEETKEKRDKVIRAILDKVGRPSYEAVFEASLSRESQKADRIYRYLIYGFHYGRGIVDMLQLPAVYAVFEMCRQVNNEAHRIKEFARFSQMQEGILVGKIGPQDDVLILVAPHFADRLSGENWILYDEKREKAVVHPANGTWLVTELDSPIWRERLSKGSDEKEYEDLWKAFHRGIAIKERTNPRCQMNFLPLRFRPYMTEFEEERRE